MRISASMSMPPGLVNAFALGEARVFVGAGLSIGAGLPDWEALIRPLRGEIDGCPADASLTDIAQFYRNQHGYPALALQLCARLQNAAPTEAHRIVVERLHLGEIYTTNFDGLLEAACRSAGIEPQVIATTASLPRRGVGRIAIVKLHGDFDYPDQLVVTTDDFEGFFKSHVALAERVKADLWSKTVLFIGYSFTDLDMRSILRDIVRDAAPFNQNHYITLLDPKLAVVKELERRGLTVISIPSIGDANRALVAWLTALQDAVRAEMSSKARAAPSPMIAKHNLPRADAVLLGRDATLTEIRRAIGRHRVVAIVGPPGVGKTSLAIRVARDCAESGEPIDFSFVVWFTARNRLTQDRWLVHVLNLVARTVDFPAIAQKPPDQMSWKKEQIKLQLLSRPTLIVLDNFEAMDDHELWTWLNTIPKQSHVLLTSRAPLPDTIHNVHCLELGGLEDRDALHLLNRYADEFDAPLALKQYADEALARVVEVTHGNPQAMRLAAGVLLGGGMALHELVHRLHRFDSDVDGMFKELFAQAWNVLSSDAEMLMLACAVFVGIPSIHRAALEEVAGLSTVNFPQALDQVLRLGLLERAVDDGRFAIHPLTRAFVVEKLQIRADFGDQARRRCAQYYLTFAESCIDAEVPTDRYWRGMVCDKMKQLDPEWPMIQEQLHWAAEHDVRLLTRLILCLVHYMDSRMHHSDRVRYVAISADGLTESNDVALEAILRIDALGWSYVEDYQLEKAFDVIGRGLTLAGKLPAHDSTPLTALANAALGRIHAVQRRPAEAEESSSKAIANAEHCPPWIRMRINLAAGDIAMTARRYDAAFDHYTNAASDAGEYRRGREQYQIYPRLGFALFELGRLDEAAENFDALTAFEEIPLGQLYRDYGMAFVLHAEGLVVESRQLAKATRSALDRHESNPFTRLLHELYDELDKNDSRV